MKISALALIAAVATGCVTTGQKAKMCRSLARYPLDCDPSMIEVKVFHPDETMLGAGDSMCLLSHQKQSVICTSRAGTWECSQAFPSR